MTVAPEAAPAEPAAPSPPPRPLWRRIGVVLVAGIAVLITGLVTASLVGAWSDDRVIDRSTGLATAEVLSMDSGKAVVRFTDSAGRVHTPDQGAAYPSGLQTGQLVQVEYAIDDPEYVRVAGRDWTVGLDNGAVIVGVTWALALPTLWWLYRGRSALPGWRRAES